MGRTKQDPEVQKFFDWIREQYCCDCGGSDYVDKHGNTKVTVSHVTPKGSQNRNYHWFNVLPMCLKCHRKFEDSGKSKREKYRKLAEEYTMRYKENHD